ncbi:MAG: TolC family protein, partial [Hyphomonadaceae bacterium]|nr:TolC family protein [Hyphomonadaceae bacterium]
AEKEARLALEALLGLPPGGLAQRLGAAAPVPAADLPARGLTPVAVVARRPDLQAAERLLASAGFDVRAARRDFFPRLTFSGLAGVQRNDPETPFNANGGVYNVAGALAAPLLTFGRLEGALAGAKAREQRAALEYRNAAVRAVSEVERALAAGLESEARAGAQARALEAAALQQRLAASRYRAGVAPFLEVLAAERAVFDAEAALAGARAEAAQAYARLSAAMGLGGQA